MFLRLHAKKKKTTTSAKYKPYTGICICYSTGIQVIFYREKSQLLEQPPRDAEEPLWSRFWNL